MSMKYIFFISIFIFLNLLSQTFENLELVLEILDPDTAVGGGFGIGLASGDLNGDGYSDIVSGKQTLGEYNYIYIYYGGPTMDDQPDVVLAGEINYGYGSVVAVGDVDGDGYDDVVAGGTSQCRVYFGGDPMDSIPDISIYSPPDAREYAEAVACGELNNDGYDDYIVGAYGTNNYVGRVYIYFGGSEPDTIPDVILNGEENSNFGNPVSSGCDVNGDGHEDLFVGAGAYGPWQGKAYIYYGGDPMDTIPDVEMYGTRPCDFFGEILSLVPDLENDGYDEAAVGEPLEATHDTVFTYFGGEPMDEDVDLIYNPSSVPEYFGYDIGGINLLNNDNFGDLSIGAPRYQRPGASSLNGKVYVYLGSSSVDEIYDALTVGADSQSIGCRVASAGDIDRDGIDDIMFSNYAAVYAPRKVWVVRYTPTGIEEDETDSTVISLINTYPNPFNDFTKIEYQLNSYVFVSLKIYDVSGRLIKTLVNYRQNPGLYRVKWDGRDNKNDKVSGGIYFCELKVKRSKGLRVKRTKKLVFLGH
ncbi:FG-GAP repeat protein [candidate division WOR-3 bacterium]|nr:FG-GAP repeat protein [candidate division WOR-3 bacterium]